MGTPTDVERYFENLQAEIDAASQYRAMADGEPQSSVADVYRRLAGIEEKHAAFWRERLRQRGVDAGPARPSVRARIIGWLARRFGAGLVLPTIASQEFADRNVYLAHPETRGTAMNDEERMHARVLGSLVSKGAGTDGSTLGRLEGRHRTVGGNALRAAVLGANDGLCSNLSLVMGIAGATTDHRTIFMTGVAGLLAGACSMALGEWVSVTSARELAEREVRIEKNELEEAPEEEREELELIYEAKGLTGREAREVSAELMKNPKTALDALSREELGIDPTELGGSPWVAASTSFLLFSLGASIPVAPYLFAVGRVALAAGVAAAGVGLFGIGAAIAIFTGRSAWMSGARQVLLGFAAAGVTFAVGHFIGVAVAS
jgi:VIT1/CCC1 family predicted Fe2+/Mn2+ transporter